MIIKYYKGYIPIEKLREETKTNKNGVSAYHLVSTAKKYNMNSYGIKIDNLSNDFITPCIAHVTVDNSYKHYVVIYKNIKEKKELLIADPASGIKKVKYSDFNKIFNGVLLIMYPYRKLPMYSKQKSVFNLIKRILFKYKCHFIKLMMLSTLITFMSIKTSFYMESMIKNTNNLFGIFISFILIYIFKNLFEFYRNKTLIKMNSKLNLELMNENIKKIVSLPYRYFKNRTTGEVLTRINDSNFIIENIINIIMILLIDLPLSIIVSIFLISINIKLFLISLIILINYVLIVLLFDKKLKKMIEELKDKKAHLNSFIVENISSFETIKGLSIEKEVIGKLTLENKNYLDYNYKTEKLYNLELFFKTFINEIGSCILIFIGFILLSNNSLTLGNLITFESLFIYFLTPIKNIINTNKDIKEINISYKKINELIIEEKDIISYSNLKFNNVKIDHLSYSYDNIKDTIRNINLEINNGEKVMIVGDSGSGKSTILKLLKKYYQVSNNKIFIDGIDINKISKKEIDENITYVSQNEILYTDTLYNNLVLNRKIDSKALEEVIKITNINFINDLGLNMLIEENGFNLSGGERQRIILARSLLNKSKILILDESLNQVDIKLERKILKNLMEMNKTIIYVSHRYNNSDLFDKVINIENGKVSKKVFQNNKEEL